MRVVDGIAYADDAAGEPRLVGVRPLDGRRLELTCATGEVRVFDVGPFLRHEVCAPPRTRGVWRRPTRSGSSDLGGRRDRLRPGDAVGAKPGRPAGVRRAPWAAADVAGASPPCVQGAAPALPTVWLARLPVDTAAAGP